MYLSPAYKELTGSFSGEDGDVSIGAFFFFFWRHNPDDRIQSIRTILGFLVEVENILKDKHLVRVPCYKKNLRNTIREGRMSIFTSGFFLRVSSLMSVTNGNWYFPSSVTSRIICSSKKINFKKRILIFTITLSFF